VYRQERIEEIINRGISINVYGLERMEQGIYVCGGNNRKRYVRIEEGKMRQEWREERIDGARDGLRHE
jgi:hypothetical protein